MPTSSLNVAGDLFVELVRFRVFVEAEAKHPSLSRPVSKHRQMR